MILEFMYFHKEIAFVIWTYVGLNIYLKKQFQVFKC